MWMAPDLIVTEANYLQRFKAFEAIQALKQHVDLIQSNFIFYHSTWKEHDEVGDLMSLNDIN